MDELSLEQSCVMLIAVVFLIDCFNCRFPNARNPSQLCH